MRISSQFWSWCGCLGPSRPASNYCLSTASPLLCRGPRYPFVNFYSLLPLTIQLQRNIYLILLDRIKKPFDRLSKRKWTLSVTFQCTVYISNVRDINGPELSLETSNNFRDRQWYVLSDFIVMRVTTLLSDLWYVVYLYYDWNPTLCLYV